MRIVTMENGTDAKIVDSEFISEMHDAGKVTFLGIKKIDDRSYALYESKRLPLVFYAVPIIQRRPVLAANGQPIKFKGSMVDFSR